MFGDPLVHVPVRIGIWVVALFLLLFPYPGAPRQFAVGVLLLLLLAALIALRPIIEEVASGIYLGSQYGFLTEEEYRTLTSGQDFLWRVRYALHMLADRPEDRLLFDYQLSLAKLFGYQDDARGLAVEHFMKDYFRWVLKLGVLNEMLIQLFDEAILRACEPVPLLELNQRFRVRNGYIEAVHDRVFRDAPWALLEIFTLMAQHEYIQGARAATIRLIHESRRRADATCRKDPRANRLFLQLLASPYRVVTQLDRMKRYGVLGRFIPEFGRIIGQTQHDPDQQCSGTV